MMPIHVHKPGSKIERIELTPKEKLECTELLTNSFNTYWKEQFLKQMDMTEFELYLRNWILEHNYEWNDDDWNSLVQSLVKNKLTYIGGQMELDSLGLYLEDLRKRMKMVQTV